MEVWTFKYAIRLSDYPLLLCTPCITFPPVEDLYTWRGWRIGRELTECPLDIVASAVSGWWSVRSPLLPACPPLAASWGPPGWCCHPKLHVTRAALCLDSACDPSPPLWLPPVSSLGGHRWISTVVESRETSVRLGKTSLKIGCDRCIFGQPGICKNR